VNDVTKGPLRPACDALCEALERRERRERRERPRRRRLARPRSGGQQRGGGDWGSAPRPTSGTADQAHGSHGGPQTPQQLDRPVASARRAQRYRPCFLPFIAPLTFLQACRLAPDPPAAAASTVRRPNRATPTGSRSKRAAGISSVTDASDGPRADRVLTFVAVALARPNDIRTTECSPTRVDVRSLERRAQFPGCDLAGAWRQLDPDV
jgi:hypothetical protein